MSHCMVDVGVLDAMFFALATMCTLIVLQIWRRSWVNVSPLVVCILDGSGKVFRRIELWRVHVPFECLDKLRV